MNPYDIIDFVFERNRIAVNDLSGVVLSERAKRVLASMINDWVFKNLVVGEEPSLQDHEHAVIIIKAFAAGYKIGKEETN
jgi:hypothetical protein